MSVHLKPKFRCSSSIINRWTQLIQVRSVFEKWCSMKWYLTHHYYNEFLFHSIFCKFLYLVHLKGFFLQRSKNKHSIYVFWWRLLSSYATAKANLSNQESTWWIHNKYLISIFSETKQTTTSIIYFAFQHWIEFDLDIIVQSVR